MTDREMLAAGVDRVDRELAGRPELHELLLAELAGLLVQAGGDGLLFGQSPVSYTHLTLPTSDLV